MSAAPAISLVMLAKLVTLSRDVYALGGTHCAQPTPAEIEAGHCAVRVGSQLAGIWRTGGDTLVAIAGTDPHSWSDIRTDVKCRPVRAGGAWPHRGFDRGAVELYPSLRLAIDLLEGNTVPGRLILCGHSMGGAVALRITDRLVAAGRDVHAVVTFGAARLYWWPAGSQPSWSRHIRVVHEGDAAPHWPRAWMGFCHHQRQTLWLHQGDLYVDHDLARMDAVYSARTGRRAAADHGIQHYVDCFDTLTAPLAFGGPDPDATYPEVAS